MIALNVISEGTEKKKDQLERMLKSVAPFVDGVFLTFTQSMDTAPYFTQKFGANISWFPWCEDFSAARNFALSQVPKEFDFIFWCDTDDVVVNATHLKELSGFDAYFMAYNYSIDRKTGEILIQHPRERLVRRDSYEWKGKLHETLLPKRRISSVYVKNIWVNHLPTDEEAQGGFERNERILRKAYEEEQGKDPRTVYYLARTCFDLGKDEEAQKLFKDYLESSGWDEERAMARNYLGEIALRKNSFEEAIDWFFSAVKERPEFPMFLINIGSAYCQMKDFDRALHYTKLALKMDMPKTAMVMLPRDEKVKALETLFIVMMNRNKYKEALSVIQSMLEMFPEDTLFKEREKFILSTLKLTEWGRAIAEMLQETPDDRKAALLYALPERLSETQFAEKLRQQFLPPVIWQEKTIAYFCGKGFEQWDDTSLEKGVGGSETAVIHLAKEWTKAGYIVVVYGDPKEEHEKDGILWLPYWKFNTRDTFDTLIIWRNESVLNAPLKAKRIWLDLHDVPESSEYTKERLEKVDKIFVKSNYHRSLLPDVPDEKFVVIPNGIDLGILPEKIRKTGNKIIWSSSYDRGLQQALEIGYPIIKKSIPDVEFHIAYGWNLFETVHKQNPERMAWKKKMDGLMQQEGIVHHGRMSQKDLLALKAECKAHFYPSTFEEIDCIGVRESAAVECVPFTTDYAALKDRPYCVTQEGNPFNKRTQEKVAENLAGYLWGILSVDVAVFKEKARAESWKNISQLWLKNV